MHALDVDALTYTYPLADTPALRDVRLHLDGGLTLITGASGGGKSTLLRVCNGLIPHFHGGTISGSARVFGCDVFTTPTRRLATDVGFVFQDPELQGVYATVERDVAFTLENMAVPRRVMVQHVDEALERTGTAHLRQRTLATLSGGERQRVALAGALAQRPRMLALDEPLAQLDAAGADAFVDVVSGLMQLGTTVLMAEHHVERVLPRATAVLRACDGTITRVSEGEAAFTEPGAYNTSPLRTAAAADGAEWRLRRVTAGVSGNALLHDVELAGGGDVVVLTGANGSGKTTLLRTLAGLQAPLAGRVERPRGRIAYLPQNPSALLYRSTVRDELQWTARHSRARDDSGAMLRRFDLVHVADAYPRDLSTGQRQRVAIAAVMLGAPRLVLLDEPTRGMDAAARAALVLAIRELRDEGASIVMATHDMELARVVADRTVELRAGVAQVTRAAAGMSS